MGRNNWNGATRLPDAAMRKAVTAGAVNMNRSDRATYLSFRALSPALEFQHPVRRRRDKLAVVDILELCGLRKLEYRRYGVDVALQPCCIDITDAIFLDRGPLERHLDH